MSSRLLTTLLIFAMMAYSSAQTPTTTTDSSRDVPPNNGRWMGRDGKLMEPYFQPINNIQIGGCCKPNNAAATDDLLNLTRTILDFLQNQELHRTSTSISDPVPLGLENTDIPDTSLTASSEFDSNHGPQRARLNNQRDGDHRGAWSARTNDANQWIQVDLMNPTSITAVQTQGRADVSQWVESYTLGCSDDGETFTTVQDNLRKPTSDRIFQANTDRNTIVTNTLQEPLVCRYVRLMPQTWNGHISLRMELLGIGLITDPVPLGLENTDIPDTSLTASSEWDSDHGPQRARLNIQRDGDLRGAWSARTNDANQWIQVDLMNPTSITSVQTQGRADVSQWVESYTLGCSDDGETFTTVQDNLGNPTSDRIFQANTDRNTIVTNTLQEPLVCRYVRLMPQTWNGHISLRMELLGIGPVTVPVPLGLENTDIPDTSLTASSEYDSNHGPERARLNIQRDGDLRGAWSARTNDANQWIQVDLMNPTSITAVQTQGRADVSQWVESYTLGCSDDGETFITVQDNLGNPTSDRIFQANTDRNTIVTNTLQGPLVCRYVRLMPQTWNGHISLRMELLGIGPITV